VAQESTRSIDAQTHHTYVVKTRLGCQDSLRDDKGNAPLAQGAKKPLDD